MRSASGTGIFHRPPTRKCANCLNAHVRNSKRIPIPFKITKQETNHAKRNRQKTNRRHFHLRYDLFELKGVISVMENLEFKIDEREVSIPAGQLTLEGNLNLPENAHGIVLFAHGSGS